MTGKMHVQSNYTRCMLFRVAYTVKCAESMSQHMSNLLRCRTHKEVLKTFPVSPANTPGNHMILEQRHDCQWLSPTDEDGDVVVCILTELQ